MSLSGYKKKRIIVWSVFGAAVLGLVLALIFYVKDTFRENDLRTQTVKDVELSPVSEAYAGKDEILGTSITLKGDNDEKATLTFPSVISEYQPEKAYILTNITNAAYDYKKGGEEMQEKGPALFKAFYGDKYDERCCSFLVLNDLETFIREDYNGKNGEVGWLGVSGYSLIRDQDTFANYTRNSVDVETYFYKDSPDKTVELPDGKITLQEAADRFTEYFKATLSGFTFGYEVRPYKAVISDYSGDKILRIVGEKLHGGIPFECCMSTFLLTENDKETTYGFSFADANMLSKISYNSVSNQCNPIIARSEPLDKIISIRGAVDVLKNNLARNADYTFIDIKLMYCCKHTQKPIDVQDDDRERLKRIIDDNNRTEDIYSPTWYFVIKDENDMTSGIKVDALTGEITMDIQ